MLTFNAPDNVLTVQLNALVEFTINGVSCRVKLNALEPVKLAKRVAHLSKVPIPFKTPCTLVAAMKHVLLPRAGHMYQSSGFKAKGSGWLRGVTPSSTQGSSSQNILFTK